MFRLLFSHFYLCVIWCWKSWIYYSFICLSLSLFFFLIKLILSGMNIMSILHIQFQKFNVDVLNLIFNEKILLSLSYMLRTNTTFKKNSLMQVCGWSVDAADCQEVIVLRKPLLTPKAKFKVVCLVGFLVTIFRKSTMLCLKTAFWSTCTFILPYSCSVKRTWIGF